VRFGLLATMMSKNITVPLCPGSTETSVCQTTQHTTARFNGPETIKGRQKHRWKDNIKMGLTQCERTWNESVSG